MTALAARHTASSTAEEGRFIPGTLVNGRYRIIAMLGHGGMGEVYRATDLSLSQQVALKFLPEGAARDDRMLARFHGEVRTARQVSHRNVCRVHDIGEADGQPFISMEYVDGEDLGSLLRRIGRLPAGKATDIARQLCAGLAALHEKGVLHRDLKPANIMIDGRGNVLITDFGLASAAGEIADLGSGTPAYMAPEQLAGTEVTARSDLYSLGLVLYEMFTGRRAFQAESRAELLALEKRGRPPSVSGVAKDVDPAVERVILRCLAPDPANRPRTAIAVVSALPGGDPLAAAVAAGETPSPELVAAAGESEGMSLRMAWTCLLVSLGVIPLAWLYWHNGLLRRARLDKPPEVLAERAREIAHRLGFTAAPANEVDGFLFDTEYMQYTRQREPAAQRLRNPPDFPPVVFYWYRQSPLPMPAVRGINLLPGYGDPPFEVPDMLRMKLDGRGRLIEFESIPGEDNGRAPPPDWDALFAAAGLDRAQLTAIEPKWTPRTAFDARSSWAGLAGPYKVRVEATAWHGKPVSFRIVGPWSRPVVAAGETAQMAQRAGLLMYLILLWVAIGLGVFFARRNLRLKRGDLKGAWRCSVAVFILALLNWLLLANHVASMDELDQFVRGLTTSAFFNAAAIGAFYLALEPFLRRHRPQALVGWSRLVAGRFGDPVVGRDVLIGLAVNVVFCGVICLYQVLSLRHGGVLSYVGLIPLNGARRAASQVAVGLTDPVFLILMAAFLLAMFQTALRSEWLAVAALIAIASVVWVLGSDQPRGIAWLMEPLSAAVVILTIARFGILTAIACRVVGVSLILLWPLTFDPASWYFGLGLMPLAVFAALVGFAFRSATARR